MNASRTHVLATPSGVTFIEFGEARCVARRSQSISTGRAGRRSSRRARRPLRARCG